MGPDRSTVSPLSPPREEEEEADMDLPEEEDFQSSGSPTNHTHVIINHPRGLRRGMGDAPPAATPCSWDEPPNTPPPPRTLCRMRERIRSGMLRAPCTKSVSALFSCTYSDPIRAALYESNTMAKNNHRNRLVIRNWNEARNHSADWTSMDSQIARL